MGAVVLPDAGTPVAGRPGESGTTPVPPAHTSSPRPSASTQSGSLDGPVTSANMLSNADLSSVGLAVSPQPPDVRLELVGCDKMQTLDDIAVSGPPVQRTWEGGTVVAYEQAVAARDEDEAEQVARQVLGKLEACQKRPAGYWVYGATHSEPIDRVTTASWVGEIDGSFNTAGRAPKDAKISGGTAVLRRGNHVAVFSINWCSSAGDEAACVVADGDAAKQLATLSRLAARRLG
ncbi:hypothetical protein [Kribbella hippodromi]|uniref:hypothetical protein n=1 Tax=Kribbella hippodromi TaxID=434347 RepID=UPI0031E1A823